MANYIKQKPYYLNVPAGRPAGSLASIPQTNKTRSSMGIMDILGAGLGAVSSIGSMIGQNRAIRQQIKAQQEENNKNRAYNLMLARLQNRWNLNQWQRENDYNSPTAQMSRFRAAGLNPNLIYGQSNAAASSPTLTSGAASSPTDMSAIGNKRNFGQAMQEMLNMEMQKAQIEAIKAGTENTKANTDNTRENTKNVVVAREGMSLDNYIKAVTAGDTIELASLGVQLATADLNLKGDERRKLAIEIDNATKEGKRLDEMIAGIKIDNMAKAAQIYYDWVEETRRSQKFQHELTILANQANMSTQEYSERLYAWTAKKLQIDLEVLDLENKKGAIEDWNSIRDLASKKITEITMPLAPVIGSTAAAYAGKFTNFMFNAVWSVGEKIANFFKR